MEDYLLKPDGTEIPLGSPADGFTVEQLQDLVCGYVGVERVAGGFLVYDDDGTYKCKEYNPRATAMVLAYKRENDPENSESWGGVISGDAVVCRRIVT